MKTRADVKMLVAAMDAEERSVVDLVREALEVIEAAAELNAFRAIHRDRALEQAAAEERALRRGSGRRSPLHGVPVALKDNIDEAGVLCAVGCRAYQDRRPHQDAVVVGRLDIAGAIIVGRTNMHELADGVTSENPHFGSVHNPWRQGYHPGGSSGGSAAAVAAGCVPLALGTDTGGSIRIPASLCGVVGLKPTRGLVPTEGVVPLAGSLDHLGPIGLTVRTVAAALEVLTGPPAPGYLAACDGAWLPRTLGVLTGFGQEADAGVGKRFEEALRVLERLGCQLRSVEVPGLAGAVRTLSTIYPGEALAVHRLRMEQAPAEFSPEVLTDLQRGDRITREQVQQARAEMAVLGREIERLGARVDLYVSPTTPHPAKPFGSPRQHTYLAFTAPFNQTGQPALSLPMGLSDGLPVGLQIIGRRGEDSAVLALAARLEAVLNLQQQPSAWWAKSIPRREQEDER